MLIAQTSLQAFCQLKTKDQIFMNLTGRMIASRTLFFILSNFNTHFIRLLQAELRDPELRDLDGLRSETATEAEGNAGRGIAARGGGGGGA